MNTKRIVGGTFLGVLLLVGAYILYDRDVSALLFDTQQTAAVSISQEQTNNVVSWLKKLQYTNSKSDSFGAIAVSDGIAVYEDETERPLRRVTPYFSHLAVLGILDSRASGSLTMAQRWIQWYVRHLDSSVGVPLDTWYTVDGTYGTTCPTKNDPFQCNTVDAEDSSAALFLVVVDKYITAGGSKSFVRNNKTAIYAVEDTLVGLLDTDGVAWAKKTYPIKYTMDNVEVLAGLEAAARLETNVFGNKLRAQQFTARANTLRTALHSGNTASFYNATTTQYAVYKDGAGAKGISNMQTWYPDLMAQVWPFVFGQSTNAKALTKALQSMATQMPPLSFELGDCAALKQVTDLLSTCMYNAMHPTYAWPVTAADAGWLLRR
jgi:hypothetical protein